MPRAKLTVSLDIHRYEIEVTFRPTRDLVELNDIEVLILTIDGKEPTLSDSDDKELSLRIEDECWSDIETACYKTLETWIDDDDCGDIDRV